MKKGTILTLSEKDLIGVIMDSCPEIEQDKEIIIDSVLPETVFIRNNSTGLDTLARELKLTFHVA